MSAALKFQCRTRLCGWCSREGHSPDGTERGVSMPHAALWVVQQQRRCNCPRWKVRFNAARGFVGGAAEFRRNINE